MGGGPGHMRHPHDLHRVTSGNTLIELFADIKEKVESASIVPDVKVDGINVSFKYADGRTYIKVQYWTSTDTEEFVYGDIWFDVESNKDWMNVAMIHDSEEKTITIDVDGKTQHKTYEGEIIDYRDSWIWIGANNSLDSCAVEHRGFLYGDISYISIFDEALTSQQTSNLFSMKNQKIFDVETVSKKTAAVYTFNDEEMTPYKVYDISNNGNHMVLFDNKWMAKNFE